MRNTGLTTSLLLALLITSSALIAQTLSIPVSAPLALGQGYDAPIGASKNNSCITITSTTSLATPTDSIAAASIIRDSLDLAQRTGITVNAIFSSPTFSSSASYQALSSRSVHSYSESVYTTITVRRGSKQIQVAPDPQRAALYQNDYLNFILQCGTHFVSRSTEGGSFSFYFSAAGKDEAEQTSIRQAASVALQAGSRLDASKFQELESRISHAEVSIEHRVSGTNAVPQSKTLKDELKFADEFESAVDSFFPKVDVEYGLSSYEEVYGPPSFGYDFGALLLRYIDLFRFRNALSYITQHPNEFAPTSMQRVIDKGALAQQEQTTILAALTACKANPQSHCAAPPRLVDVRVPQRLLTIEINPKVQADRELCRTVAGELKVFRLLGSWIANPGNIGNSEHAPCDISTPCTIDPPGGAQPVGGRLWILKPLTVFSISIVDPVPDDNVPSSLGFLAQCGDIVFPEDIGDDFLGYGQANQQCTNWVPAPQP